MLDRLRACIVSSYYGQARQPGGSEVSEDVHDVRHIGFCDVPVIVVVC